MLYFRSMKKKHSGASKNKTRQPVIISTLLIPLFILKLLGDFFLTLIRLLFKLFSKTYNFIIILLSRVFTAFTNISKRHKKDKKTVVAIKTIPIYDRKQIKLGYIFRKEFKKIKFRLTCR